MNDRHTADTITSDALDQLYDTNQRLNLRAQRLESELAAYGKAVAEWEIGDQGTYVPLRTLAAIAKAAGLEVPARWELHFKRVERAEATVVRVRALAERWENALAPDRAYARSLRAALDEPAPVTDAEGRVVCTCTYDTRCGCGTSVLYQSAPPVPAAAKTRACRYCPDPRCPEDCPECGAPIHDLDAVPPAAGPTTYPPVGFTGDQPKEQH